MTARSVLLVNPNRMRPVIAPIALDYLAPTLREAGYEPQLCDLSFAADWEKAIEDALRDTTPVAVGVTVRNLDDAYFASQDFTLEKTRDVVWHIQEQTSAPVVLGGVGFSCAPREVLQYTGAPYGIAGDGEEAFVRLLNCLLNQRKPLDVSGLVFRSDGTAIEWMPSEPCDCGILPAPSRRFVDNPRYFAEGGQIGLETKRGCNQPCRYCVDPIGKGRRIRLRPADIVAREVEDLLDQGIDVLHLCDSEFNLPRDHALAVCDELSRRGTGARIRWYTYATPLDFDGEVADAMARAGCVGINFGVDHADPGMLQRLGRLHGPEDLRRTATACRDAGLVVMFDMLLGGPGESPETISRALDFVDGLGVDRVGLSCGVRVYPGTALAHQVRLQGPMERNPNLHGQVVENHDLLRPIFFVDASVGKEIQKLVWSLVRTNKRFVIADPDEAERNYNYNDNSLLVEAIRAGERGAYWHILQRLGS